MEPEISIIIPTFNRKASLLDSLDCICRQKLQFSRFEAVVVDDGSTDGTNQIAVQNYPYELRVISQPNQGSAAARNLGAEIAEADRFVFIDDDIRLEPDYLAGVLDDSNRLDKTIVMGTFLPYRPSKMSIFHEHYANTELRTVDYSPGENVEFSACVTNNLVVRREDFFAIGKMQDVAGDGPTLWGDVDFGYRAKMLGFRFWRSNIAHLIHNDHTITSLQNASKRAFQAAEMSRNLENKYPGILKLLPMFADKMLIDWQNDSIQMIMRKLLRTIVSSGVATKSLESIIPVLERGFPDSVLLRSVYRWIIGGYIYRGYRRGLRELRGGNLAR